MSLGLNEKIYFGLPRWLYWCMLIMAASYSLNWNENGKECHWCSMKRSVLYCQGGCFGILLFVFFCFVLGLSYYLSPVATVSNLSKKDEN